MTRNTQTPAPAVSDIDPAAYYLVVLAARAVLPHETLPVREEPYEMSGRMLQLIAGQVQSYTAKVD